MLLNYETVIVGERCVLVPYRPQHVPTYHSWMQDPELLQATASEPLTLEQEYEMQSSWKHDPKKCTFIVLARNACKFRSSQESNNNNNNKSQGVPQEQQNRNKNDETTTMTTRSAELLLQDDDGFVERNLHPMAGDVNLFLSREGDDDDDRIPMLMQAEIDIMIAEPAYRSQGLGRDACTLMLQFGARYLGIGRFYCKIHETNVASLNLFRSMGFTPCGYAACFQEIELELRCATSQQFIQALRNPSRNARAKVELQTFMCRSSANDETTKDVSK